MDTRKGIIGGIVTVLLANITSQDLLKTAVLAVVGTMVSYLVTLVMKRVVKKWKGWR